MMDCAHSDHPGPGHKGQDVVGHMDVTIPSTVLCDPNHCVLQWLWIATHRSITRPEIYDQCADVRITGAQQKDMTTATVPVPERRVEQTSTSGRRVRLGAEPVALSTGEDAVRRMITASMANGGEGDLPELPIMHRRLHWM